MKKFIAIICIISLIIINLSGEEEKKNQKETPFLKALLEDQAYILTSPTRINKKNWYIWVGTIAVTSLLIKYDEKIYKNFKTYQNKNSWVDEVSPKVTLLGDGGVNLAIAGGFFLSGLGLKDNKSKETARLLLMTYIQTGVTVQIGKHLFGRQRPSWDNGIDKWHGIKGFADRYHHGKLSRYDAFPSGHTISAMGSATVISEMYKNHKWVPWVSYSLATLCGLSRVTEDTHWLSDVFLGTVMGIAIGKYIVKKRNRLNNNLVLIPNIGHKHISLSLNWQL